MMKAEQFGLWVEIAFETCDLLDGIILTNFQRLVLMCFGNDSKFCMEEKEMVITVIDNVKLLGLFIDSKL